MADNPALARLGPDHVARFLSEYGISVQFMSADTSTAVSAAKTLNTTVAAIVKSLVFMGDVGAVVALVSGDRLVETTLLADLLQVKSVRLARPKEVIAETGYAVGGVPPIAHRRPLRVLMDRHLCQHPLVYAAAGSSLAIFAIEPNALSLLARAEIADFVA